MTTLKQYERAIAPAKNPAHFKNRLRYEFKRIDFGLNRHEKCSPGNWARQLSKCATVLNGFSERANRDGTDGVKEFTKFMSVTPDRLIGMMKTLTENIGASVREYRRKGIDPQAEVTVKYAFDKAAEAGQRWKAARGNLPALKVQRAPSYPDASA